MKKYLLGLCLVGGMSITKVNNYNLLDRVQIGIDLMTDDEKSLKYSLLKPLKDIEYSKELEVAYTYLIDKYHQKLTIMNIDRIGKNFDKLSAEQTALFKDAINAIYLYKTEDIRDGFIKLSILDDLLPNEDILFLILTGQEEKMFAKLENMYFKNTGIFYKEYFFVES